MGRAGHLSMHRFQKKAHVLGLGFGLDRTDRVVDLDVVALGDQHFQFGLTFLDTWVVSSLQCNQPLDHVQLKAYQQQL